jgi:uncharacterized protein (TIGR02284 family)
MDMYFANGSQIDNQARETLQQLMQANVDSGQGYQEAAADVFDDQLAGLFRTWSTQRLRSAQELRNILKGVRPSRQRTSVTGTWLDSWRRIWLSARGALNTGDRAVTLRELERAEGYVCTIIATLFSTVEEPLLVDLLGRHLDRVRDTIDILRELRTATKSAPPSQWDTWTGFSDDSVAADRAPAELAEQ